MTGPADPYRPSSAGVGADGPGPPEVGALAARLRGAALSELAKQADALTLPQGVQVQHGLRAGHGVGAEGDYRAVDGLDSTDGVMLVAGPPAAVSLPAEVGVRVRRDDAEGPLFQLVDLRRRPLPVELREVYPVFAAVLELRIRLWIEDLLAALLDDLDTAVHRSLEEKGYL